MNTLMTTLTWIEIAACLLLLMLERTGPSSAAIPSQSNRPRAKSRYSAEASKHGPGFYNHSGCLYAHIGQMGQFEMITADDIKINETLELDSLDFDEAKSKCVGMVQPGKLTFSYKFPKADRVGSIIIAMRILPTDTEGYWEVSQANLTVIRADIERKRTFPLRLPGIYAGSKYSYSCSKLVLTTLPKRQRVDNDTKVDPMATLTLTRFQLQPFKESKEFVFEASYDCSTWFTLPGLMGLILILFMTLVTVIGVSQLKSIETSDLKFSKEGLIFTQAQIEVNKQNR